MGITGKANREGPQTTQLGRSERVFRIARVGHEDAFPRPRLSARCRFSQETLAGTRGNGRDAPKPAVGCIGEAWRLWVLKLRGGLRFRVVSYLLLPRVQTVRPNFPEQRGALRPAR